MAHQWRGVIREYADRLPMLAGAPTVTLLEGGTPLIPAAYLSERVGAQVFLKYQGLTPPGSSTPYRGRRRLSLWPWPCLGSDLLRLSSGSEEDLIFAAFWLGIDYVKTKTKR